MADTAEPMFICDVYPTTYFRVYARVTLYSTLIAGTTLICTHGFGLAGRLFTLLIATGLVYLFIVRSRTNHPLEFQREWLLRQGWRVPESAVTPSSPPWLSFAAVCIIVLVPNPVCGAAITLALAAWVARSALANHRRSLRAALRYYSEMLFLHIGYPDARYRNPGGTSGLWLPTTTRGARAWQNALRLVPLAFAWTSAVMAYFPEARGSHVDTGQLIAGIAIAALIPLPYVVDFAMHIDAIATLHTKSLGSPSSTGNDWQDAVNRVANSKLLINGIPLSEHFFIGYHPPAHAAANHPFKTVGRFDLPCRSPALLYFSILYGNAHILGSTQAGKTSLSIFSIATQLIRGFNVLLRDAAGTPRRDRNGGLLWGRSEPSPMLIIDLKGDLAFYNTIRIECEKSGQTFRHFTLCKGHSTAYFNPITNLNIAERPITEFAELTCNSLSLFHGLGYGRSYYSRMSRDLLIATLKRAPNKPQSWEELHELLLTELNPKKHKDVFELVSTIFALAQFPMLGPPAPGADAIHMPTVIANREVVFFSLPARLSAISARDVAKLALFSFITAAADWNDRNPQRRCFVFLDEAQIICSSNLAVLFQQASGAKTAMILSNQARSDLDVPDVPQLSKTVRVNSRFQQMFTIVDSCDSKELIQCSGDRVALLRSTSGDKSGTHEVIYPVITQNDINLVNNDPNGSMVLVTTGGGLTQHGGIPQHVQSPYTMSLEEYNRRMHTPWPEASELQHRPDGMKRTVVNTQDVEEIQQAAEDEYAKLMAFFQKTAHRAGRHRMSDWQELGE